MRLLLHVDTGSNIANECYVHLLGPFITALKIMEGVWQSENCNIVCYTKVIIAGKLCEQVATYS